MSVFVMETYVVKPEKQGEYQLTTQFNAMHAYTKRNHLCSGILQFAEC